MGHLSIRTKVSAVFVALGFAIAFQGFAAISRLQAVNHEMEDVQSNWMPSVVCLGQIRATLGGLQIQEGAYIMTHDPDGKAKSEQQMQTRIDKIATLRAQYESSLTSQERETYRAFGQRWEDYLKVRESFLELSRTNADDAAVTLFRGANAKAYDAARFTLDNLIEINQAGAAAAAANGIAIYRTSQYLTSGLVGVAILVLLGGAILVLRGVIGPIKGMTATMGNLAQGNVDFDLPATQRPDEVGAMARAIEVFRRNKIEADRLAAAQEEEHQAKARRAESLLKLTVDFDAEVSQVLDLVSGAAIEMERTSTSMSSTAEETSRQATSAAAAATQASTNVYTVAAAADQLSASIREIGRQVTDAARVARNASEQGSETEILVKGLTESVDRIESVVQLINHIAAQTNLLALNATIEASRAGEAGKGFAVVANEVKQLAHQTAKATEEISLQISGVQKASQQAGAAIVSIVGTVEQIDHISSAIAAAVEQQSAATEEIARNVEQAATGTSEVTDNVSGVHLAAGETGHAASNVRDASGKLARQSVELKQLINGFLAGVRAA